jgi:hypothetical protein
MFAMTFTPSAASSFLRIRVIAGLGSGMAALFAGVFFVSALFSHWHVLVIAALVALAISLLSIAVTQGMAGYLLFKMGSWTTLGGRPTSRSEQPARFPTWITFHGLLAAVNCAAAAVMIWIAISWGH